METSTRTNQEVVARFWERMSAADWEGVAELLADDFVAEWPQSSERIRGRAAFVAVNRHYPGSWAISVRRLVADGDQVVTEVGMTDRAGERAPVVAVSFFELRDGRIVRETDWWPEPYPAPAWRSRWVEPIPGGDALLPAPSAASETGRGRDPAETLPEIGGCRGQGLTRPDGAPART
jgi:ketosteroid isomerase-like protein